MNKQWLSLIGCIFIFSLSLLTGCSSDKAQQIPDKSLNEAPTQKKVVLYGYEFKPKKLKLKPGMSVVFKNKEPEAHNITIPALAIDETLNTGETFTHTFETEGEFAVSDESIEKSMRMTIIVRGDEGGKS